MPNINPIILTGGAPPTPTSGLQSWVSTNIVYAPTWDALHFIDTDNDWDKVAGGDSHALAIKDGKLYAWGSNVNGRTGLGFAAATSTDIPIQVGTFDDWTHVSAGSTHSLAIRDGRLYSWGINSNGQLGHGDLAQRNVPTQVGTDTDWTACSAGTTFSLAIKNGVALSCGLNTSGRTGLNLTTGNTISFTELTVGGSGNVTSISAGNSHGLLVKNGTLWSWGLGTNSRTGHGDTVQRNVPEQVGTDTDWSHGTAGSTSSAMIKTNGELWSFGAGANGQLGTGNTTNRTTPFQVGTDTDWQEIKMNGNSATAAWVNWTIAIKNNRLYTVGINSSAQTGTSPTANKLEWQEIGDGDNYIDIGIGSGFGLAIRKNI